MSDEPERLEVAGDATIEDDPESGLWLARCGCGWAAETPLPKNRAWAAASSHHAATHT